MRWNTAAGSIESEAAVKHSTKSAFRPMSHATSFSTTARTRISSGTTTTPFATPPTNATRCACCTCSSISRSLAFDSSPLISSLGITSRAASSRCAIATPDAIVASENKSNEISHFRAVTPLGIALAGSSSAVRGKRTESMERAE